MDNRPLPLQPGGFLPAAAIIGGSALLNKHGYLKTQFDNYQPTRRINQTKPLQYNPVRSNQSANIWQMNRGWGSSVNQNWYPVKKTIQ